MLGWIPYDYDMVLPNMKHAWDFAGFKDRHDELRREAEVAIEDGSRSSDCHRVVNVELEKERQRVRDREMVIF